MVMEAVSLKVQREDARAAKDAQRRKWHSTQDKENFKNLDQFR